MNFYNPLKREGYKSLVENQSIFITASTLLIFSKNLGI